MIVEERVILDEEGRAHYGVFIDSLVVGIIIGLCVGFVTGTILSSMKSDKIIKDMKTQNYYFPKSKANGLYIQMPDGKLYKRQ